MLATRFLQPEIMDDPSLDLDSHVAALQGLQRIHALSGTFGRLWQPIEQLLRNSNQPELSIMDVGCGDALMLRKLWHRARAGGWTLKLVGCDFSPRALELSRVACDRAGVPIELQLVDVTRDALPGPVDVIINSLFLHHFQEAEVIRILEHCAHSARQLVLIEDLLRSRLGYYLCWLGVRVLTRSKVVHIDGPLSVRAAFSLSEIRTLLDRAGMAEADLTKTWPERFNVSWHASAPATPHVPLERSLDVD